MSFRSITVILAVLATGPVVASASDAEWLNPPGTGIARLFSWNDDFVEPNVHLEPLVKDSYTAAFRQESLETVRRMAEQVDQVSFMEEAVETRVHEGAVGYAGNAVSGVASGAGLGAGAGKSGSQATFADANAAANRAASTAIVAQNTAKTGAIRGTDMAKSNSKQPLNSRSWFGWMRFSLSFAFLVKTLCMMCNIFYQSCPLPLIHDISTKGDTGDADLAPFIAVCYGGWQWCFYGFFAYIVTNKSGFLVLVYSNVVGATLGLYYVYAFTLHCKNVSMLQRSSKYYQVLVCVAGVQVIAIATLPSVKALFFSGLISSAWSVVSSMSVIVTVPTVYETRSSATLPIPLLVMGAIAAVLWIVCGVMLSDPWITVPNVFALGVCTFGFYLCWKFPAHSGACAHGLEDGKAAVCAKVDSYESTCDFEAKASPLQRAMDFVHRSTPPPLEKEPIYEQRPSYGGTGGTGDGF